MTNKNKTKESKPATESFITKEDFVYDDDGRLDFEAMGIITEGYEYVLIVDPFYGGKNVFRTKTDAGLKRLQSKNRDYRHDVYYTCGTLKYI